MKITLQDFRTCLPNLPSSKSAGYHAACADAMQKGGIDTPREIAMFLAQIGHESNDCAIIEENLNYRASRLLEIFPRYFTAQTAASYAGKPEAIANRVYGGRMGNGKEATGDGYKYRGRGVIQLTGRNNYRSFGRLIGVDLENTPERATAPEIMFKIAVAFWNARGLSGLAESGNVRAVTKAINGGYNGLQDRINRYQRNVKVLG